MSEDALLYEMPEEYEPGETGVEIELRAATQRLVDKGHVLEPTLKGDMKGHVCKKV